MVSRVHFVSILQEKGPLLVTKHSANKMHLVAELLVVDPHCEQSCVQLLWSQPKWDVHRSVPHPGCSVQAQGSGR